MQQETDLEASSPLKPALLAPVQLYLLLWQMVTGGDPAVEDQRQARACQVNVDTTEHLPLYVRSYFYSFLGMK